MPHTAHEYGNCPAARFATCSAAVHTRRYTFAGCDARWSAGGKRRGTGEYSTERVRLIDRFADACCGGVAAAAAAPVFLGRLHVSVTQLIDQHRIVYAVHMARHIAVSGLGLGMSTPINWCL